MSEAPPELTELKELPQIFKDVLKILISPQLQEKLFALKIIFIVISVLFFITVIWLLVKSEYLSWEFLKDLKNFLFPRIFKRRRIIKKWKKIKEGLEGPEAQWKVSLMEAAELLDNILEEIGYRGENLREKLNKLSKDDVSNLNQVLAGEQVCQDIARDPDYILSKDKAKEIIEEFERALKDLNIL